MVSPGQGKNCSASAQEALMKRSLPTRGQSPTEPAGIGERSGSGATD